MNPNNLKTLRNTIYLISVGCLAFQLILSNQIEDYFSVILIFLSNVFLAFYCYKDDNILDFPISSNIIFISYFINIGAALYFKSLTGELITDKLKLPIDTIFYLILFHFIIVFAHVVYKNSILINQTKTKLSNFFLKNNLIKIKNNKFLIFIGAIALILKLVYFDLNTAIIEQTSGKYPSLARDIILGLTIFIYAPFLIFFSNKIYNLKDEKNYTIYYIIFFVSIFFLSLSTNSRTIFFDISLFIFFAFYIYFQQGFYVQKKFFIFKSIIIVLVSLPLLSFLDTISKAYLLERSIAFERSPIQNFNSTLKRIISYNETKIEIDNLIKSNDYYSSEDYYDNSILNRFNILLVNDNINYILKKLPDGQIDKIKNLELKKIVSILPQPLISLFNKNFEKTDYLRVSMGSFIYRSYNPEQVGRLSIGSLPFAIIFYFKIFWPLITFFISIIVFFIFDVLYHKKEKVISPIAFFLFYGTALGMLNIFTSSEISKLISFTIRITPQTILLYFILFKIHSLVFMKKH